MFDSSGCWGIHATKKHVDSDAVLTYDYRQFDRYMHGERVVNATTGVVGFKNSGELMSVVLGVLLKYSAV